MAAPRAPAPIIEKVAVPDSGGVARLITSNLMFLFTAHELSRAGAIRKRAVIMAIAPGDYASERES